ncbi:MAG: hypothetical protein JNJ88_11135 [Planctomycetes bacterium]|nr:hypothetical protein [Planctomycetota bacterium]
MAATLALACPACGAAGGPWLFLIVFGTFVLMFSGTILMFLASWWRGEWHDNTLRWSAIESEYRSEAAASMSKEAQK